MNTFEFRVITEDENIPLEDVIEEGLFITEAAIGINLLWLKRNPHMDCALTCGMVKYDSANKNAVAQFQKIKTGPILVKEGKGLCIEIVALDCAIRRLKGQQAFPKIFFKNGGLFHVTTEAFEHGTWVEYDPSAELEKNGYIVNGRLDGCNC